MVKRILLAGLWLQAIAFIGLTWSLFAPGGRTPPLALVLVVGLPISSVVLLGFYGILLILLPLILIILQLPANPDLRMLWPLPVVVCVLTAEMQRRLLATVLRRWTP